MQRVNLFLSVVAANFPVRQSRSECCVLHPRNSFRCCSDETKHTHSDHPDSGEPASNCEPTENGLQPMAPMAGVGFHPACPGGATIGGYRETSPIRTDLCRARPGGIHDATRYVRRDEPGGAQALSNTHRLSQQPVAANWGLRRDKLDGRIFEIISLMDSKDLRLRKK